MLSLLLFQLTSCATVVTSGWAASSAARTAAVSQRADKGRMATIRGGPSAEPVLAVTCLQFKSKEGSGLRTSVFVCVCVCV